MVVNIKLMIINAFTITIINDDYYHFDTLILLIIITQFLYDTVTTIHSVNRHKRKKIF